MKPRDTWDFGTKIARLAGQQSGLAILRWSLDLNLDKKSMETVDRWTDAKTVVPVKA